MLLFIASSITSAEEQPQISVTARVDKAQVKIGDSIKYSIEVKAGKDIEIQFPYADKDLGSLEIKDSGTLDRGFWGTKTRTQWYILESYQPGEYTIPPAAVKYRVGNTGGFREISTDPVSVQVLSTLTDKDSASDIKDIRGPLSYYNLTYLYILLIVLAVVIIIILAVVLFRKMKKSKITQMPPRPAHEIALEALKELMNRDLITSGQYHAFYVELSNIVRHYLENRFRLRAPEMTTEEFLSSLRHTETLGPDHKNLLREFMLHCDMVKFARYRPENIEIQSSYNSARMLVEQTKEILEGGRKD